MAVRIMEDWLDMDVSFTVLKDVVSEKNAPETTTPCYIRPL
jgi:hypothetical protein